MAKINRNNYEIFFLDYYEGNLPDDRKKELFSFLDRNPDLKNEFESFEMLELPPATVFYGDKESLKKDLITKENYQQYLIAKLEGDITKEEQNELNKFLFQHPEFKKEEKLFSLTKLSADASIVYPEKSKLKRAIPISAGNKKVFYYSVAAAACILLLLGVYFLRTNTNEAMQANNEIKKENVPVVKNNDLNANENKNENESVRNSSAEKNNPLVKESQAIEKSLTENQNVFANNADAEKNKKKFNHKKANDEKALAENKTKIAPRNFETIDLMARKETRPIEWNENMEQQIAYVNINLLMLEIGNTAALNSYLDQITDPDAKSTSESNSAADTNSVTPGNKLEKNPLLDSFAWGLSLFTNKDVVLKKSFNEQGDLVAYQLESGKFRIGKSSSR